MKKHGIILLILASAAIAAIIFSMVFSFFSARNTENVNTAQSFSDDILVLDMKIGAADIRIVPGTQFRIETDNPHITAEEKQRTLVIREKSHIDDLDSSTLTLYIPKDYLLEDAEITTGAGKLEIEALNCRELELKLGAGMAEIHSLTAARSADIEGGAGQILIHDSHLHDLDFEMGVGEAEIFSLLTGNAEISTGIGRLALTIPGRWEDYTIDATSGLGKMDVSGLSILGRQTLGSGSNRIELKGGIGEVSVFFEP